eukprot:4958621-Pleurochrysis_carterae.AAC.1
MCIRDSVCSAWEGRGGEGREARGDRVWRGSGGVSSVCSGASEREVSRGFPTGLEVVDKVLFKACTREGSRAPVVA